MDGLIVLVVDEDAAARAKLIDALRELGLHALGAFSAHDAQSLLAGLEADLVLHCRRTLGPPLDGVRAPLIEIGAYTPISSALAQVIELLAPTPSSPPN